MYTEVWNYSISFCILVTGISFRVPRRSGLTDFDYPDFACDLTILDKFKIRKRRSIT